ncbi:fas apoptotic inhibitory molecule 3 isoform X1 [Phyllostomus discolor]|uniref:Fas apoptotic inhibitory molecule 3 isoform X1 n=1 Tax=Phyllostomus discolor TaxID=89673 RepID=A0A6J2N9P5_9CHIR|nr:fas apoptotic inhibitory molecule 3 isoform X1 [Phyllostomus discolor]XP_035871015.1 fas apoptotic inhibitory molecule 3 isoform X1 [Phyllostomus discolor]
MDLWLWLLYFLPVSGALKKLPEVKLEGMLGRSIVIECPLPKVSVRFYLCREMAKPGACITVVSTTFVKEEYKHRTTLNLFQDQNLFVVEITELTKNDSGVYACGAGMRTDRDKTQKVILDVHSVDYEPFWEKELMLEIPPWFQELQRVSVPPWFRDPAYDSPFEFIISKVSTSAPRTEAPPAHHPSPTTPVIHHPRVSRASSVAAAKHTTLLPSTTDSKTSAPEGLLRPQTASYDHHSRLYRKRAFNRGPVSRMEGQGFHILIPTALGLILLILLGLMVKKVIRRKRALSRRVRQLAVRMRALEASQRPLSQRPPVSQWPRSQNNVYSACPRRDRGAHAAGEHGAPAPDPGASAPSEPSAPLQVSEAPWPHMPSLKTSCEYISTYYQPAAKVEDTDLDDYVNISCLTHPSSYPPGPKL